MLLKLDRSGTYQWHTFYGSGEGDYAYTLALDGSDDMYVAGHSYATWDGPGGQAPLHAHSGDWDNLADIAKVESLVKRLLDLDETYYYGSPHLAMGILKTLLPKALGGRPEEAKVHFEKAIELSEGKFLPAQVTFAQRYARLTFDRDLHDRLLKQVMETPVDIVPELTLINAMAKKQAAALLADADDYF